MNPAQPHEWRRVSRHEPCVVCGRPDWCGRTADGSLLRCMRGGDTPSYYETIRTDADGGTLYGIIDDDQPAPPPRRKPKPRPRIDWAKRHAVARARVHPGELEDMADAELGLPAGWPLELLEVGVDDEPGSGWLFPERDATGKIIGLVRRLPDGRKVCINGSRRGLTYQHPLPDDDPVLICEGASDTAAAMLAGYTAVGRPNNTGGGVMLAELLKGRAVIVLGENDRKPDGTWPGRDGAERIARLLCKPCKSVRLIFPPDNIKDLRGWMRGEA